jgi:hypothetical protein
MWINDYHFGFKGTVSHSLPVAVRYHLKECEQELVLQSKMGASVTVIT